jgi:hypothetical protein
MTRDELLKKIEQTHDDFVGTLTDLSEDTMTKRPVIDWWMIKDLLGHIAMWQQVALQFIAEYKQDGSPQPLGLADDAAIDAYNKRGVELRRDLPLAKVRAEFDAAHRDLVAAVKTLSDDDLNKALPAPWKDRTLEYLIKINTYTHTPEHTEQIKRWRAAQ